jgi:hypothetical protein
MVSGPCPHCGYLPVPKDREFYVYPPSSPATPSKTVTPRQGRRLADQPIRFLKGATQR